LINTNSASGKIVSYGSTETSKIAINVGLMPHPVCEPLLGRLYSVAALHVVSLGLGVGHAGFDVTIPECMIGGGSVG